LAFTANDYIVDAAELYGDVSYDRIEVATWIRYLNAAIRTLILVRPDAGATTESVLLAVGVKQALPTDSLKLLDITHNMGNDGATIGQIITPVDRSHLDFANILWPVAVGETSIENYSYDFNNPRTFYVSPPVHATTPVYIEMTTSKLPTAITAVGDDDGVDDTFFEPLVQYMLYKAYSADDESAELQKAQLHIGNFFNLLQVEMKASSGMGPERKE
jgi:hypothetical protein